MTQSVNRYHPHAVCSLQDNSLLSVGGQPGGNPEAAGDERPSQRHAEVAAEPPERQHGAQGDVRPRHRTLLQRGGLLADGEGHEDAGHPAGYERVCLMDEHSAASRSFALKMFSIRNTAETMSSNLRV